MFVFQRHNHRLDSIPSHQGIKGNDEADIAAKEATSPSLDVIPYQDFVLTLHHAEKKNRGTKYGTPPKKLII